MQMKKGHVCIFDKNKKEGFAGDIFTVGRVQIPHVLCEVVLVFLAIVRARLDYCF